MVNETQRQQYLEAIGIDSYMPRWLLPVAPEPVRCEAPVVAEPEVVESGAVKPEVAAESAQQSESAGLDSVDAIRPEAAVAESAAVQKPVSKPDIKPAIELLDDAAVESKPLPSVEVVPQGESIEASFALGLWRVSEDLLVVDSRQAELALPVDTLLSNILAALGYPRVALPKLEVVRWPYGGNAFSDKSAQAARHMMSAMMTAKLEQQPVKYLLLLGDSACHYLLPDGIEGLGETAEVSYSGLLGKAVRLDDWNCSAIVAPSLAEMLQQPELKAVAWDAIQPLRLL
ncbi:MAG: hypothetical protein AseanaTS_27310 [Candidatus Pelagadaptatus aseana]|uniref:hypothetical protein n=1 Tax=Candidatus Pelagadaptatus aseana TaxID=3120508 RepID=UPI0039B2DA2A